MSLEKRLKALREKETKTEEAGKRTEQTRSSSMEERRKQALRQVQELERFARQEILPALQTVNKVYLEGGGKLSVQGYIRWKTLKEWLRDEGDVGELAELFVELRLIWGGWGSAGDQGGECIWLQLHPGGMLILAGGLVRPDATGFKLNTNAAGWQKTLKADIYSLLSTPGACSWRETPSPELFWPRD